MIRNLPKPSAPIGLGANCIGQICAEDKLHPDKVAEILFEIGMA